MVNTTIALTTDDYQLLMEIKHDMEKQAHHQLSYSSTVHYLCDQWNQKIKRSDIYDLENKE
jgi:hypothetical protein